MYPTIERRLSTLTNRLACPRSVPCDESSYGTTRNDYKTWMVTLLMVHTNITWPPTVTMKLASTILASLLAATSVAAHATFQEFWVGSTDYADQCLRKVPSNSPVTSVSSSDVACNAGAGTSPGLCPVVAGSQVTVEMHQQVSYTYHVCANIRN
jgi:hypothetical protein